MVLESVAGILQYWEGIAAVFAIIISTTSLRRDKRSRQMDMLHEVFRNISNLNTKLTDLNRDNKDSIEKRQDGMILLQEKFKEFDYLCFLINRKKVREKDAYDLGAQDLVDFYENYNEHVDMSRYSDIESVVDRWRTYPPNSRWNRIVIWLKKTGSSTCENHSQVEYEKDNRDKLEESADS